VDRAVVFPLTVEESEDDEDFEEDEDACFSGAVGDQDDVGEATQNKRRGSVVSKLLGRSWLHRATL